MVEFALIAILCLALIGAVYDFGVLFFRQSLLTHSIADVTRRSSAQIALNSSCEMIEALVRSEYQGLSQEIRGRFPPEVEANLTTEVRPAGNSSIFRNCTLTVRTNFPVQCFFCLLIPERNREVTVASRQLVENHDWCAVAMDIALHNPSAAPCVERSNN